MTLVNTLRNTARLILALTLTACAGKSPIEPPPNRQGVDPFEMNGRLGRGVNFGNALEAPLEGQWGVTLEALHFRRAAEAGFATIRLPVRWSAHAQAAAPYTIVLAVERETEGSTPNPPFFSVHQHLVFRFPGPRG
jgi:aryl-phospho-beta-D-glucosidase BglC (GH1 family)